MTDRTRIVIGRSMAAVGISAAVAGWIWVLALTDLSVVWDEWLFHNGAAAIGFGLIVWLVLPSQPRNGAIWTSAAVGVTTGLFGLTVAASFQMAAIYGYTADSIVEASPSDFPPLAALIPMMGSWLFNPLFLAFTAGVLLFPDGKPPSPRWRWAIWTSIGGVALSSLALMWLFRPSGTVPYNAYSEIADSYRFGPALAISEAAVTLMVPVSFAGLIVRFRRSTGIERQQLRLVVWGAAVSGALILLTVTFGLLGGPEAHWLALVMIVVLIGSYGLAIGKYRLYDIDVVISRTFVYATLAVFITAVYVGIVVELGQVISGDSSGLLLPIAATAVVAVAFEPVRLVAQRWANRFVYGKRATPYEVLSQLMERLAVAEESEGLLVRMASLLRDGTGAESAAIWLGSPGEMTIAAVAPADSTPGAQPSLEEEVGFLVFHDEEAIGAIEVVKPRGSVLSFAEKALVSDLAGSAGAVLGYQHLNDSLEARALELEESRARLVGAQDQERRRLERDLHEGAEQYIVALKVKIGVAAQLAAKHDAVDLENLLDGLTSEAQAALDDVQSLAKGIYPPILESDGLGAAISALARSTPVDIHFDRDGIGRYPAEVEAAVYFDVSEAVTNAVKHADPPIRIVLLHSDGVLTFSVVDAGPGFEIDESEVGSGLENMADRLDAIGGTLTVISASGESTEVFGTIPVEAFALI